MENGTLQELYTFIDKIRKCRRVYYVVYDGFEQPGRFWSVTSITALLKWII